MPTQLWSIALQGDPQGCSLFADKTGRIVVSTTRRVESDRPAGLNHPTAAEPRPGTTYVNFHALHCYVIAPDGRVEWTANEVNATCEAPDGGLVATNDRHEFVVLDRHGAQVERRAVDDNWSVIGWDGAVPIFSSTGALWVAPRRYSVHDHHLYIEDAAGNMLSKTPIARDRFDAACRERPDLARWPDAIRCPHRFDLAYHTRTQRLIASHGSILAWTMSLGVDGTVDWLTLTGDGCCNNVCFVGDALIAHASSCGQRLSFLTTGGQVLRAHHIDELSYAFPDGQDGVCAKTSDSIRGFDATGEQRWSVEVPELGAATAHDGVLYTLAGETGLEISAFALR